MDKLQFLVLMIIIMCSADVTRQPNTLQSHILGSLRHYIGKRSTAVCALQPASPLRGLACHIGSHSVTCHPAELTFPPTHKHSLSYRSGGQQHSFIRSFLLHAHMYMPWIIKQRSTRRRAPAVQMSLHCDVTLTHLHCDLLTCCHSPLPLSVCLSVRLSSLQPVSSTIRYDTRCYFNVRSKADISQLNLPHGTDN